MNIRLIAMDLDGTLSNDEKKITPLTREALMDAQKKGIRLVLASARPAPGLYREANALSVREYGGILMSYNGGCITDAASGRVLYRAGIETEIMRDVLRMLKEFPVTPILDDGVQFYVEDKNGFKVEYECQNNCMECAEVDDLSEFLNFSPVKVLMSVDPAVIKDVQKVIAGKLPEGLTVVQTAPFYLEVIPREINKGEGLKKVCELLGVPVEETIAFGDAENDIPMLKAAGMGVAMGNADENTKAAADCVTRSNNEDGIAAALQYFQE